MTIKKLLDMASKKINEVGKEEFAGYILFQYLSGYNGSEIFQKQNEELDKELEIKYFESLDKYLIDNIPIQYIVGFANFFGYDFIVNDQVLIPRNETEELVENIIYLYDEYFSNKLVDIVDIGTGCGEIGLTLGLEINSNITLTDISKTALEVAKKNADKFGIKTNILEGNMLEPIKNMKFDIVVSNPPYIPDNELVDPFVKDNEPNVALFGGIDGMKFYKIILSGIKENLKNQAIIGFEHGYDKKEAMYNLANFYFPNAKIIQKKDMEGKDRMTFLIIGFDHE